MSKENEQMSKDLRAFINEVLEKRPGEIKEVTKEVDPKFEITALASKVSGQKRFAFGSYGSFPALFCRKVKGSKIPLIINLTAHYDRLALALGTTRDNMVQRYAYAPETSIKPVFIDQSAAPVKEVILTGKDAKLSLLPIPTHNELDVAPFITSGLMVCKDPDSGLINMGLYRHQLEGEQQLGLWAWDTHHAAYIRRRYEAMGKEMEVAIAIGHHPCVVLGAISTLPAIGGEYEEASALLGEPLELCQAETVDLPVPARAEIIIEGKIPLGERVWEGPFAEWPGTYVAEGEKPFIKVTAITMRKDAIYYDVFSANREHTVLGSLPRMGVIYRNLKQYVPSVQAINIPAHSRMHCYISIKKESDMEVKRAAMVAYITEPMNLKTVVVVDDDIDVFDDQEVLWAIGTRCHLERDVTLIPRWSGPGGLNPVGYRFNEDGSRTPEMIAAVIIDATKVPVGSTSTRKVTAIKYSSRAKVPQEVLDKVDPNIAKDMKSL
jgi:2,5-furandicarboxylate decarboxylase 1